MPDDYAVEGDETFFVVLSNPVGGGIGDYLATVTIEDDDDGTDSQTSVWVDDLWVDEDVGTATVTVNRDGNLGQTSRVQFETLTNDADAGQDFLAVAGTLGFEPGASTASFDIQIVDDGLYEPQVSDSSGKVKGEVITVRLTASDNAEIIDDEMSITIVDNDATNTVPALAIGNISVDEEIGTATAVVFRDGPHDATITVSLATRKLGTTATPGADFIELNETLTFLPSETSKSISIEIIGDALPEPREKVFLELSDATNAEIIEPRKRDDRRQRRLRSRPCGNKRFARRSRRHGNVHGDAHLESGSDDDSEL